MGYNPQYKNENKFKIECPLKPSEMQEIPTGLYTQERCAWFMIKQRACAINVLARVDTTPQIKFDNFKQSLR